MIPTDPVPVVAVDMDCLPLWSWHAIELDLRRPGAEARSPNLTSKVMQYVRQSLLPRASGRQSTRPHARRAMRAAPLRSPSD